MDLFSSTWWSNAARHSLPPHQVLLARTVRWTRRRSFWKEALAKQWSQCRSHPAAEPVERPPRSEFLKHAAQTTHLELNTVDASVILLLFLFTGTLCKKAKCCSRAPAVNKWKPLGKRWPWGVALGKTRQGKCTATFTSQSAAAKHVTRKSVRHG